MLTTLLAATDTSDVAEGLSNFRQGRFAEAFQAWWHAAAVGDPRGDLYLGVLYDTGQGVVQDYAQAMAWYRKAAQAGSTAGAFNVGVLYDAGLGVAKDPAQAASWYAQAASRNSGRAEYNLAMMYETGTGVPMDRQRAIELYRDAAAHRIQAARTHLANLGERFAGGTTGTQETEMQDIAQAQTLILSRSPAELAEAAELFRRSAEHGNALAQYDLGYCYEHGTGVKQDDAQALAWYRRAASLTADTVLRSLAQTGADYLDHARHRENPTRRAASGAG